MRLSNIYEEAGIHDLPDKDDFTPGRQYLWATAHGYEGYVWVGDIHTVGDGRGLSGHAMVALTADYLTYPGRTENEFARFKRIDGGFVEVEGTRMPIVYRSKYRHGSKWTTAMWHDEGKT